jgi:CubicO group peptidase (beta-lactamase class C family)
MPSGMTHSKITDGAYPNHGVAHAYSFENGAFKEDDYGEYPTFAAAGNGGVWCSILDLAKYEKALRNAVFLSAKTIEISQNILIPENWDSTEDPDVGYSWFISEKEHQSNDLGVKIISHTGWQGGFRAFYISIPEKDILYIGLFNRPISNLSESYNPFTKTIENLSDVRVSGLKILQEYNWLDN